MKAPLYLPLWPAMHLIKLQPFGKWDDVKVQHNALQFHQRKVKAVEWKVCVFPLYTLLTFQIKI